MQNTTEVKLAAERLCKVFRSSPSHFLCELHRFIKAEYRALASDPLLRIAPSLAPALQRHHSRHLDRQHALPYPLSSVEMSRSARAVGRVARMCQRRRPQEIGLCGRQQTAEREVHLYRNVIARAMAEPLLRITATKLLHVRPPYAVYVPSSPWWCLRAGQELPHAVEHVLRHGNPGGDVQLVAVHGHNLPKDLIVSASTYRCRSRRW